MRDDRVAVPALLPVPSEGPRFPEESLMPDLLVEREGPVLVLTLNRPARQNAMTLAMFARLADAWD